jgi:dihydroneopterin aldolase
MHTPRIADAGLGIRHVFIRDLVLAASIGVYPSEHAALQRVRINLDLAVIEDAGPRHSRPAVGRDDLARVVDYEAVANIARGCVAAGHVQLVETLAERIAEQILADPRIRSVHVRVEKLDVFADAASAGVEIERRRA